MDRCAYEDIVDASNATGLTINSFEVVNGTAIGAWNFVTYLNELTADAILVCSRQRLCEGINLAIKSEALTYKPKGIAMSPCASRFHPAYTITSVPWSHKLNITCDYTGWTASQFYDIFFGKFRIPPTYHAASAFSSGLTLLDAIEKTQSFDPDDLLQYIRENSFSTVYGTCSFQNDYLQCDMKAKVLQKVSN